MDTTTTLLMQTGEERVLLAKINGCLSTVGLKVTPEDARSLATRRAASLAEVERVEFGVPAVATIAEAVADSPLLTQHNLARTLAELQDGFYMLRDELPVDVPDDEIIEALCGYLDEWGDATDVASASASDIMAFSEEYVRMLETADHSECRIVDEDGRAYSFDSTEWDYDEQAAGWDGERWTDDWNDEQRWHAREGIKLP